MTKQAFFFWGGVKPLPFFNFLSILTFRHWHPDWDITLFRSSGDIENPSWGSGEQDFIYSGPDYMEEAKKIANQTYYVDFAKIGFSNNIHAVHKSDILRNFLLFTNKGLWVDIDTFWLKSIESLHLENFDVSVVLHPNRFASKVPVHSTGVIYSSGNRFFGDIFNCLAQKYNPNEYQSVGPKVLNELFPSFELIKVMYSDLKITNLPYHIFYPYHYSEMEAFYNPNFKQNMIHEDSVCVHWFGGAKASFKVIQYLDLNRYEIVKDSALYNLLNIFFSNTKWKLT
jgi:hypothetical protein